MNSDLNNRFNNIKGILFPRWDLNQDWKITNNNKKIFKVEKNLKTNFLGYCDKKSKIIYLNLKEDDWKIDMLIVHEICHSFRNCGTHGKLWKGKMIRIAERCDRIKKFQLADQIRHELEIFESY